MVGGNADQETRKLFPSGYRVFCIQSGVTREGEMGDPIAYQA